MRLVLLSLLAGVLADLTQHDAPSSSSYPYWLNVPDGLASPRPLTVWLHGADERGARSRRTPLTVAGSDLDQVRDSEGLVQLVYWQQQGTQTSQAGEMANSEFVLLAPQLPSGQRWNPTTIVGLISTAATTYDIDTTRIAIAGHSLGSKGVWATIEAYSSTFRAAIPISDGPDNLTALRNVTDVPISAWFGVNDTVATNDLSVATRAQDRLVSLGSTVSNLTVLPTSEGTGHFISNAVFNDANAYVLRWLLDAPAT